MDCHYKVVNKGKLYKGLTPYIIDMGSDKLLDEYIAIERLVDGERIVSYIRRNPIKKQRNTFSKLEKIIARSTAVIGTAAIIGLTTANLTFKTGLTTPTKTRYIQPNKVEQIHTISKQQPYQNQRTDLQILIDRNVSKITNSYSNSRRVREAFSNLSKFDDYLTEASMETGLDKNLLYAVFASESRGELRAKSSKQAVGPAQLIKTTAKEMGMKINNYIDERYEPKSLIKGAYYLKKWNKFNEDYLMLAAYNWGPGNTKKAIRKYGKKWEDLKWQIPKETRDYIIRVLSRKKILDENKLIFQKQELFSEYINNCKEHKNRRGDTLYGLSKKYRVPVEKIKEANPRIRNFNLIDQGQKINIPLDRS